MTIPVQQSAPPASFRSYVPATEAPREFTLGAIVLGVLLNISTSATMFVDGVIGRLVDRRRSPERREGTDADSGPGVLLSSGLIAGGAIMGVLLAGLAARQWDRAFNLAAAVGAFGESNLLSVAFYIVLLAIPLYLVARRVQRIIE